jgi:tryptophan synthase alpha chain
MKKFLISLLLAFLLVPMATQAQTHYNVFVGSGLQTSPYVPTYTFYNYSFTQFIYHASEIGIDGIILPDVPFEEKDDFDPVCRKYGVDLISLIAPTSEDRIAMIAKEAAGFIYIVSSLGVTGVRSEIRTDIGAMTELVRANTDIPCAVGFGISTPEQAAKMAALSDGAIVGSAIVKIIAKYGRDAAPKVEEYVRAMKEALRALH